jgi:hemerythrin-like domain-containing protein
MRLDCVHGAKGGTKMEVTLRSTELLRADHQSVLEKLDVLECVIDGLGEPEAVVADLKELGAFFRTGIWTLIWKEEDALFPEIKQFVSRENSPIKQMLLEHAELRRANERFQRGVNAYLGDPGNREAVALIRESGGHIIELLRNHFRKEDDVLLTIADTRLNESRDRQILTVFETIEADLGWCFANLEESYS